MNKEKKERLEKLKRKNETIAFYVILILMLGITIGAILASIYK